MPERILKTIELLEQNAATQASQLEAILALVEADHPAHHLLVKATQDARDRQQALEAAWKAAAETLADS